MRRLTAAVLLLCGAVVSACGNHPSSTAAGPGPSGHDRPAMKTTCPSPDVDSGLPAGVHIVDRTLQPFSPTLLGVHTLYRNSDRSLQVEVVSGGYADDITEPYDDLDPTGTREVRGHEAFLMAGTFVTKPVYVAMWSEPGEEPPCNTHAVVTVGLTAEQFSTLLDGLR